MCRSELFIVLMCFCCGICLNGITMRNHRQDPSSLIEYFTKPSKHITIHIRIHIDHVLTKKLSANYGPKTRRRLKFLSNRILNEVESYFRKTQLNQRIRFNLLDTRFLKNNSNIVTMDENASTYLRSYCDWQASKKMDKRQYQYYSVLITGLDIYNKVGEKIDRTSTARGYMGGMCSIAKSCTILEWDPRNSGFLLAHEIAHSLGVSHDGSPYNQCNSRGYMMAARYHPTGHPRSWSPCSLRALKRYLKSKKAWCLRGDYH